jgi:glycine/sarcosine N-methyltransferase
MSFYNTLALHYSNIFPLSENHLTLFDSIINKELKSGLDIGCATGIITKALQQFIPNMIGIDLSETMIDVAKEIYHDNIEFKVMDMTSIASEFKPEAFDIITCLGNTLVHVNHERVKKLFNDIHCCLTQDGQFIIQVVNYDLILNEKRTSLPSIINENIEFHREYVYLHDESTIMFNAKLVDLKSGESFSDETVLYPITHLQIVKWLKETGFDIIKEFGAWNMSPYDSNSSPSLIIVAKKK